MSKNATDNHRPNPDSTTGLFYYPVERYAGSAAELAQALAPLGIQLKTLSYPCTEYRDNDRRHLEIGNVAVYAPGRIVAWACSDTTDAERIVLLRTAERVITHGADGPASSWQQRTTTAGRPYLITAVSVFPDGDELDAAFEAATQPLVDEQFSVLVQTAGVLS